MAYKAKPATAAWIQRERKRQRWTTGDLVEKLDAIGVTVSRQTIQVWESNADRRPSAANLDALERLFGTKAPDRDQPTDAVAAALDRLGDRLVAAIEAQGHAQARSLDTLAELLGGALSQLAASLERRPDGSAGLLGARPGDE